MSENSENIEAKLCAYVEGDLDEAGRVEIERHLEQHPNHRRLLAELKSTRELLRFLPREKAPSEIAEAFNERLERSALLDAPASEIGGATHTENLIPRFLAMAAIVILTAGLAVVVYFALPRGESGTQIAMPTTAARPSGSELATSPSDADYGFDRVAEVSKSGDERMSKRGDVFDFKAESSKDGGATTGPSGADPVYVVVFADNLPEAVREVTSNLEGNQIHWEPAEEPRPQPLNLQPNQVALARAVPVSSYAKIELDRALVKKRAYEQNTSQQFARQESQAQGPIGNGALEVGRLNDFAPTTRSNDVASESATEIASAGVNQLNEPGAPAASDGSVRELKAKSKTDDIAKSQPVSGESESADANNNLQQQAIAQSRPADGIPHRYEQVAGIRARMTRSQMAAFGNAMNNTRQSVELIADDANLQTVNVDLQQQRQLASPQPATDTAVAQAAPTPNIADAAPPTIESADAAVPINPANAASDEAVRQSPAPQRQRIATKVGPRSAGAAQEAPAAAAITPTTDAPADEKLQAVAPAVVADKADSSAILRRGSSVTVTVDELASPDTDKTTTVSVQRDGTIRLPKLQQPLAVDGITRLQAETAIAEAYKSAGVIDSPTVSIEAVEPPPVMARNGRPSEPTSVASSPLAAAVPAPATARVASPATQSHSRASTTVPSTQRAASELQAASTQLVEEPLDVVILVSQQGQSPTTEPAAMSESEVPATRESDVQN